MPYDVATGPDLNQLEETAALLEASGQYRVLRRVGDHPSVEVPANVRTRVGHLLDLETTGLDPAQDEIIGDGHAALHLWADGTVYAVGKPFSRLGQP